LAFYKLKFTNILNNVAGSEKDICAFVTHCYRVHRYQTVRTDRAHFSWDVYLRSDMLRL